ncbi:hypothetical protein [Sulfobacillus thermosulfidooxidans]|uniref:hypothetical protein n=1 Tax=Sulfobacillus thermosulfidooxidans TaxID=28034 RepID=UPI0006B679EE|nr:hypothetical protein [Sulfobacillus thermosulfidooxidans]
MFVDQIIVRGAGALAIVGGIIFFAIGVPQIGYYLVPVGIVFLAFTIGWKARYERVLDDPPPGYEPTGEVYVNPGGPPVEVWHSGIRRVYVRHKVAE